MTLKVEFESGDPLGGSLLYRATDYAFNYEEADASELGARVGDQGTTSLVADTLQLEVGVETGVILYAWGYFPKSSWVAANVPVPKTVDGILRVRNPDDLESGISLSILSGVEWRAEFDRNVGLLKIVPALKESSADGDGFSVVRIADGVAIGVRIDQICSVWLWPKF